MGSTSKRGRWGCPALIGCAGVAVPVVLLALLMMVPLVFRGWALVRERAVASQVAPADGRFVEVNGLSIYVQEHGPKSGPPVVLISGTSAWSGTWRDTQAELSEQGFRVIALDLPPFGYSDRPVEPRYSRPAQAERILGVMDALRIEQAVLVGHSFGGGPTLEAVMMAPNRVSRLVLVDAALSLDFVGVEPGLAGYIADTVWLREIAVANTFNNPWMTRTVLKSLIFDADDASPDRIALYQQPMVVRGATPALGRWLPELISPDSSASSLRPAQIRKLHVPTLLIWGSEDTATPPQQAKDIDALLPDSRIVWLDGVGHIPQIEDVPAFHRALIPFLGA